jgi:hypothetical protein
MDISWCPSSSSTLHLLTFFVYRYHVFVLGRVRDRISCTFVLLLSYCKTNSIPIPLRVRTHCWKSRASETDIARYPTRDSEAIRFLCSATSARLLNNLPPFACCTTTSWRRAIEVQLLPGGPSGTVKIFLHQLWMTISNNSSWWMIGMEPLVPPAPVPPHDIPSYFSFYLLVF